MPTISSKKCIADSVDSNRSPETSAGESPSIATFIRVFLGLLFLACFQASAATVETNLLWRDIREFGLEGQAWRETKAPFDRLPAKAEGRVNSSVWGLSRQSAGLHIRFVSDSAAIHARWSLTSPSLGMYHMPATGVSGLDLYVKTPEGKWRWLAVGRPEKQTNVQALVTSLSKSPREYLLYLPLYNGVSSVDIGVTADSSLTQPGPWGTGTRKPVLYYGTSIQQGACASRPGMAHGAILGRRFNFPHINLGFSGSGRMEPEMAELLASVDPSIYVLDCLPNMGPNEVAERVEPFVKKLRQAHPKTPVILVEDRSYADSFLVTSKLERNMSNREALRAAYKKLRSEGVKDLYYLPGENLLGQDGEGTVDSSHPNDLGFVRQADAMEKIMRPILKRALTR